MARCLPSCACSVLMIASPHFSQDTADTAGLAAPTFIFSQLHHLTCSWPFAPTQVRSRWAWWGSVRPSTDGTGPAFLHGCLLNGSPRCSLSSWASSRSRSPAGSWWRRIGAGKLPSTLDGSPSPGVRTKQSLFFFFHKSLHFSVHSANDSLLLLLAPVTLLKQQNNLNCAMSIYGRYVKILFFYYHF